LLVLCLDSICLVNVAVIFVSFVPLQYECMQRWYINEAGCPCWSVCVDCDLCFR